MLRANYCSFFLRCDAYKKMKAMWKVQLSKLYSCVCSGRILQIVQWRKPWRLPAEKKLMWPVEWQEVQQTYYSNLSKYLWHIGPRTNSWCTNTIWPAVIEGKSIETLITANELQKISTGTKPLTLVESR